MKKILSIALAVIITISSQLFIAVSANQTGDENTADLSSGETALLAFPGAEGGGKYTKGARGVFDNDPNSNDPTTLEVYHVTNLNSEGEGSLADAVSRQGRLIVFDVGGVIDLPSTLRIENDNITILGQTAPGDGITITGGDVQIADGAAVITLRNLTDSEKKVNIFTAQYGSEVDILTSADSVTDAIAAGAEKQITLTGLANGTKAYIWNDNYSPYCDPVEFTESAS